MKGHGHTATPIHLQILCGCTPTARADRSCGTDYPAHKAKNIYSVAPFRSLLSFDFAVDGEPLNWFQQKILIRFVFTVKNGSEKVRPGAENQLGYCWQKSIWETKTAQSRLVEHSRDKKERGREKGRAEREWVHGLCSEETNIYWLDAESKGELINGDPIFSFDYKAGSDTHLYLKENIYSFSACDMSFLLEHWIRDILENQVEIYIRRSPYGFASWGKQRSW